MSGDNSMTRYQHRDGICPARLADRPAGLRLANGQRQLRVGASFARQNRTERSPNASLKRRACRQVQGWQVVEGNSGQGILQGCLR
jgi:hypothetical protein